MAVEAPERSGSTTPASIEKGVGGWLAWMGQLLAEWSWLGFVEFSSNDENDTIVSGYPLSTKPPAFAEQLAMRACLSGKAVNARLDQDDASECEQFVLALPLEKRIDGSHRAFLMKGAVQSPGQRAATIKLCRWASIWLDQATVANALPIATGSDSLSDAVLKAIENHGSAQSAAMAIVSTVKRLCGCKRVGIASTTVANGAKGLNLIALSDQVKIDSRRILPAQIVSAMAECFNGAGIYSYPDEQSSQDDSTQVSAHAALFENQGACPSLSLVYPTIGPRDRSGGGNKGKLFSTDIVSIVVLLERPSGQPFSVTQIAAIQILLGPTISLLRSLLYQEMNGPEKMIAHTRLALSSDSWQRLNVQQWLKIGLAAALLCTLVVPVPHRVSAQAAIRAKDLQVLIAPQNGFIATSHVRAGDSVKKEQMLATLDTRELLLSANKWRSEAQKNRRSQDQALATRDKVKLAGLRADATRIAAELALTESQLLRTELKSPFDGVVLSGDLSQSLGSPVMQGDTLFTIGSSDEYELILDVEEQDVGLISNGQAVRVRMAALPNETWHASVESVLPVAVASSEYNVFRVPAHLEVPSSRLRPGMEGVAKIYVGKRAIAWVYTRTLREQVRLILWRLGIIR